MDNIKNDSYYVKKLLKDLTFLLENTRGISLAELEANEILCDSVLFRLIQISENAGQLTSEFKALHREIPWHAIRGLRNRIVHDYGEVEMDIVYQTITEDIPDLCQMLQNCQ